MVTVCNVNSPHDQEAKDAAASLRGADFEVTMDTEQLSSFQQAPADANYKCGQCGNILSLKKGQLLPPCPRCGYRHFDRTEASAQC